MEWLRCTAKFYDPESHCIWAWFTVMEEDGDCDVEFKMPVNNDDFEIGCDYNITWREKI